MGVIIESLPLAQALATGMDRDMNPSNSWRVSLTDDHSLQWQSDAGTLSRQPARDFTQRLLNLFFKLFPQSLY
jgi:hypothetical protein